MVSCSVPICSTVLELKPSIPTQEEDQPRFALAATVGTIHEPETAVTALLAGLRKLVSTPYPDQLVLVNVDCKGMVAEGKARVSNSSRRGRKRRGTWELLGTGPNKYVSGDCNVNH